MRCLAYPGVDELETLFCAVSSTRPYASKVPAEETSDARRLDMLLCLDADAARVPDRRRLAAIGIAAGQSSADGHPVGVEPRRVRQQFAGPQKGAAHPPGFLDRRRITTHFGDPRLALRHFPAGRFQ